VNPARTLPRWVRDKLAHPAASGHRHPELVELSRALVHHGHDHEGVFRTLRPNYGPDVPDAEIRQVIRWAEKGSGNRIETPFRVAQTGLRPRMKPVAENPLPVPPETAVKRFLAGRTVDEAAVFEASPVRLSADWRDDCAAFLAALYRPDDLVNIVTVYGQTAGKARPVGKGKTISRAEWLRDIAGNGVPQGEAGAWIRMNPLDGEGVADSNVAAFRFALLEFDALAPILQIALFALLPLPIVALITSGGRSVHAWVRVDASDAGFYRESAAELFRLLQPFGVDTANKNPSRLARLPGAQRGLGRVGDGRQRLLYLAPDKTGSEPIL